VWTTTETAEGSGVYARWAKLAEVPPGDALATDAGLLTSPALMSDGRELMQFFVVSAITRGAYQVSAAAADHWPPATGTPWPHP